MRLSGSSLGPCYWLTVLGALETTAVRLHVIVCLGWFLAFGAVHAADGQQQLWPDLPEVLLKDAQAVMYMNRPYQLMEHLEAAATEASLSITPLKTSIAQRVYRARQLNGIDLSRPGMLLWRKGRAPLIGIIPIADRDAFLKDFGRVRFGSALMIRVGENQGTTVYKQNTEQGMIEYRLLIRDQTAYLGRSAAECNLLSQIELQEDPDAPMYTFYIDKPFDFMPRINDWFGPSVKPMEVELKSLFASEYDLLLQQIESCALTIDVDVKKALHVDFKVKPAKDSTLALWANRQQNQSSRLLPLMKFDKSSFAIYGNVSWSGGIKELGNRVAKIIERYAGDDASLSNVAKALAAWTALLDRRGAFANVLHLQALNEQLQISGLGIHEQARAIELLGYQQILDRYFSADVMKKKSVIVGDLESIGGKQSYWKSSPGPFTDNRWWELSMAADAHVLESWGVGDQKPISERALDMFEGLEKSVSPIGEAGVLVAHINAHNILREISNLSGSIGFQIDDAVVHGFLQLDNDRNIIVGVEFSLKDVAKAIGASDWIAVLRHFDQLFQNNKKTQEP